MNTTQTPKAKLASLTTEALIAEYEVAIRVRRGRYSEKAPQQVRVSYIVNLLDARADNGDAAAHDWFISAV